MCMIYDEGIGPYWTHGSGASTVVESIVSLTMLLRHQFELDICQLLSFFVEKKCENLLIIGQTKAWFCKFYPRFGLDFEWTWFSTPL